MTDIRNVSILYVDEKRREEGNLGEVYFFESPHLREGM